MQLRDGKGDELRSQLPALRGRGFGGRTCLWVVRGRGMKKVLMLMMEI